MLCSPGGTAVSCHRGRARPGPGAESDSLPAGQAIGSNNYSQIRSDLTTELWVVVQQPVGAVDCKCKLEVVTARGQPGGSEEDRPGSRVVIGV